MRSCSGHRLTSAGFHIRLWRGEVGVLSQAPLSALLSEIWIHRVSQPLLESIGPGLARPYAARVRKACASTYYWIFVPWCIASKILMFKAHRMLLGTGRYRLAAMDDGPIGCLYGNRTLPSW